MRIGILTFHCAHNYGAVLQCYALQIYLQKRGHDVYVIDYRPEIITNVYKWFQAHRFFRKNLYKIFAEILLLRGRKRRYNNFNQFIETELRLAPVETINKDPYDLILVGSDQVWNFNITGGFDKFYWGDFSHPAHSKVASYAASMHDKWTEKESREIILKFRNFYKISVREIQLSNKLIEITGRKDIVHVVDPTLLLTCDDWRKVAIPPKMKNEYLLLYQVEGKNERTEKIANEISKQRNLKIVRLFTFADFGTSLKVLSCSPFEFIGLFVNASFVVCSSFHGTIFSLQFRKPFLSVRMNVGKDNRVENLLEPLGLSDHFVDQLPSEYDGSFILDEYKFEEMRQKSIEYLSNLER